MTRVVGKGACDPCCTDWKQKIKELWENYQEVVKGIKTGPDTVYPDGNGIADIDDAIENEVARQISDESLVTSEDLQTAISDMATIQDLDSGLSTLQSAKQDKLVNQLNIKSINGQSMLGSGNLHVLAEGVDWDEIENKPTFATVATSGDYDDLTDKPTIPTGADLVPSTSGVTDGYVLTNDDGTPAWRAGGGGGSVAWGDITGTLADQTDLKNALDLKANVANSFELITKYSAGNLSMQPGETKVQYFTFTATSDYDYITLFSVYDTRINPLNVLGVQNSNEGTQVGAIQLTNMSQDTLTNIGYYVVVFGAPKRGAVGQHWIYGMPTLYTIYNRLTSAETNITSKLNEPSAAGTAGQVLKLDSNLDPVWANESGGGGGLTLTLDDIVAATKSRIKDGVFVDLTHTPSQNIIGNPSSAVYACISTNSADPTQITVLGETVTIYMTSKSLQVAMTKTGYMNVGLYMFNYSLTWSGQTATISSISPAGEED